MRRIKLTNNSLLEYKNGKWYKNGKPFTDYELKKKTLVINSLFYLKKLLLLKLKEK